MQVLLSDSYLDPSNPRDNTNTVQYLNNLARREGLEMQARIFRSDLAAVNKIHNKGIIVDGRKVLVSSVNWSYNSPANNREVSLILDHPAVGEYYTDIFTYDWYNGAPADWPIITEVDAVTGFVELAHFGREPVEISGWTLSARSGEWPLPARTTLQPGVPLVVARNKALLLQRHGPVPSVLELPDLTLLAKTDALRLRRNGYTVDAVAWGGAVPGWTLPSAAQAPLCRINPGKDTNTRLDWRPGDKATPGEPGCGV